MVVSGGFILMPIRVVLSDFIGFVLRKALNNIGLKGLGGESGFGPGAVGFVCAEPRNQIWNEAFRIPSAGNLETLREQAPVPVEFPTVPPPSIPVGKMGGWRTRVEAGMGRLTESPGKVYIFMYAFSRGWIMAEQFKPITEARRDLTTLSETVHGGGERFVITNQGKPKAVLLGWGEYKGLLAAAELLSRPKDLARSVGFLPHITAQQAIC
jgi:prevent-host-death family protein